MEKKTIFKFVNMLLSLTMTISTGTILYYNLKSLDKAYCKDFLLHIILSLCASIINIFGLISCCGIGCSKINFIINFLLNNFLLIYNVSYYNDSNNCLDYYKKEYNNLWILFISYIVYQGLFTLFDIFIIYYYFYE